MIPRKQIGWSQEENLLWEISKQLDKLVCVNTVCPTTSTSSTTTTTTTIPLVNASDLFQDCNEPCGAVCVARVYYDVWMTQECIDSFPTIGCGIWEKEDRTESFPDGTYNLGDGTCIVITDGVITDIIS
jgi:hypothetical protein